ncbi:MAG: GGDEF domain-containing protein [Vitreoscilla sp.]|nr:GGDEF domain-containing protein [Vitreoscilla sp.]
MLRTDTPPPSPNHRAGDGLTNGVTPGATNGVDHGPSVAAPVVRERPQAPQLGPPLNLLTRPAAALPAADVAIGDCGDLLLAVKTRLRQLAGQGWVTASGLPVSDVQAQVQGGVLECATALDQLHATLVHAFGRSLQLERDLRDTQAALVRAGAELAGTQAGERYARHLALHDALTQLPNQRHFHQHLCSALQAGTDHAMAVLYLDLDGFKAINDTHGHDTGDELLRIVAARLARAVRGGDLVGRVGGDEFACLLCGALTHEQLQHLACKLFDAVATPVRVGLLTLSVSPSIGIATCPDNGTTAEALLRGADAAMYRAKRLRTGYSFVERPDLA